MHHVSAQNKEEIRNYIDKKHSCGFRGVNTDIIKVHNLAFYYKNKKYSKFVKPNKLFYFRSKFVQQEKNVGM